MLKKVKKSKQLKVNDTTCQHKSKQNQSNHINIRKKQMCNNVTWDKEGPYVMIKD